MINWEALWGAVDQRRRELSGGNGGAFVGLNAPDLVDLVPHAEDPREKTKSAPSGDWFVVGGMGFKSVAAARQFFGIDGIPEEIVKQN